ncbi:MAG: hypothetical protein LT067_05715 [Sulfurovum sp.]|nr:hypothetical protein [Sulfurovum sp.]
MSMIEARIDLDYKNLKKYFEKMFEVLENSQKEEREKIPEAHSMYATSLPDTCISISHLMKPDMVINIYSYLEFWLQKICLLIKDKNNLTLNFNDIKGNNDFHQYRKYIEIYFGLQYDKPLKKMYDDLDKLRLIRNKFIHNGGYVQDNEKNKFKDIEYISVECSNLISIEKEYICLTLESAKNYLLCIIKNNKMLTCSRTSAGMHTPTIP